MTLATPPPSEILGSAWRHCRLCGAELPMHQTYLLQCVPCAEAARQRATREAMPFLDTIALPFRDFDETNHHPPIDAPCGLERRTP